jgi:hypothetical protein
VRTASDERAGFSVSARSGIYTHFERALIDQPRFAGEQTDREGRKRAA